MSEHSLRGSTGEVQSVRVVGAGPSGRLVLFQGEWRVGALGTSACYWSVLSQQRLHPHHCNGLGRCQCLPGEEGKPGKLPRVPAASHLQTVPVLSFWPRGRRRRQAGDRQGSMRLFRSWADSASVRKLVKEEKKSWGRWRRKKKRRRRRRGRGKHQCIRFTGTRFQILGSTHTWGKLSQNPSGPIGLRCPQVLGVGNQVVLKKKEKKKNLS